MPSEERRNARWKLIMNERSNEKKVWEQVDGIQVHDLNIIRDNAKKQALKVRVR